MKKSKIFDALVFTGLLWATTVAFGGTSRTITIDDSGGTLASYPTTGIRWFQAQPNVTSQDMGFTMKIGGTTLGAIPASGDPFKVSSFRMYEDGFLVLGPTVAGSAIGRDYQVGNTLDSIRNADNSPAFVISPFYYSLDSNAAAATTSFPYVNGNISSTFANVDLPTAAEPTPQPTPPENHAFGRATWYGLGSPLQPTTDPFYGQVELRDIGSASDGDFAFFISLGFATNPDIPTDAKGGFSFGNQFYQFSASEVINNTVFQYFEVAGGKVTGYRYDDVGVEIERRTFFRATDPDPNGVPSPAILTLLAIGGLGYTRLQRKKA
jgi:hypothetical protein